MTDPGEPWSGPRPYTIWDEVEKLDDALTPRADREAIARVIRDVAELPDRTSPDDAPDMMLVTAEELELILERHLALGVLHPSREEDGPETDNLSDIELAASADEMAETFSEEGLPKSASNIRIIAARLRAPHPPLSALAEAERALEHAKRNLEPFDGLLKAIQADGAISPRAPIATLAGMARSAAEEVASALTALRAIPAMTGAADPRNREEAAQPNGWRDIGTARTADPVLLLVAGVIHEAHYKGPSDGAIYSDSPSRYNWFSRSTGYSLYDGDIEGWQPRPPPPSQEAEG